MRAWLLLPLILSSCVSYHDMYNNQYASLGGDADVTFPGGGHMTHSHTASFQHFTQAVTTVAGSVALGHYGQAKVESDNVAATSQKAATLKAQTQQAKIAAEAAKTAGQQSIAEKALETGSAIPH